jgi:hypothetical protein
MNKFAMNDINILNILERRKVRYNNPCQIMPILDSARNDYGMNNDEVYKSLEYLGNIDFLEGRGAIISFTQQIDIKFYSQRSETMAGDFTLEQRKAARYKMLEKIYEGTGGSENSFLDIYEIGDILSFPQELTETTATYLGKEGLIVFKALGGIAGITHSGIKQYEQAASKPDQDSEFFPAPYKIQNILNIEKVVNSPIQMGNINSSQAVNVKEKYDEILVWVQKLEETLRNDNKNELLEKMSEDIELIKNNISTGKPSNKFIGIALNSIHSLLIGIGANAIYGKLIETIPKLIG